jgi:hypothetical protein
MECIDLSMRFHSQGRRKNRSRMPRLIPDGMHAPDHELLIEMPKRRVRKLAETALSRPVRVFLEAQGYTVRSEVRDCDITAVRGDELIIVELKRSFATSLLVQAAKRQRITDSVYVAIPRPPKGMRTRQWRDIEHLLRRLELGLIIVAPRSKLRQVEIVFHPLPFERRKRPGAKRAILREIEGRSGDFNRGGSARRPVMTAYRENAMHIACALAVFGPLSPKRLRDLGTGPKTLPILYNNVYGWFERIAHGVYNLGPAGRAALRQYRKLAARYRAMLEQQEPRIAAD